MPGRLIAYRAVCAAPFAAHVGVIAYRATKAAHGTEPTTRGMTRSGAVSGAFTTPAR